MEIFFKVFDRINSFLSSVDINQLFSVYWFLFILEIPRYHLIAMVALFYRFITRSSRKELENAGRLLLYRENPLVSIIVPGKNEGKHIYKLAASLREQTYKHYELIVIDDGSDDDTPIICKDLQKNRIIDLYLRLRVRGGKAGAANYGVSFANGKYIVHVDADSSLDRDAIEQILIPFYMDKKIKCVGGCVKVRNGDESYCSSMQALEYFKSIMVGRIVSSTLGIYHIVSGAFGAFEAKTLRSVGGWDIGPGLDGDITQKFRKVGSRIYFANRAICLTNVPTKWFVLFRQRYRWSKSLIRFRIRKHRNIFNIFSRGFYLSNFISNVENVFFDCILSFLWLFYIIQICIMWPSNILVIFIVGYLIRLFFGIISFFIDLSVSERKSEELYLFKYVLFNTLYEGYFLRVVRLIAHINEFFFFSSYKDPWNPRKTSIWSQLEGT